MKNLLVVLTGIMTGCWFTVSAQEIPDTSLTGEEEYYVVTLSGTRLFEDMENLSSVLMIIPANEKVRSRQEVSVDGTREEILVKRYGREVGEKIARGAIWRGMNRSMVYDSWGKPLNIDRYHELDKTIEVWSYRNVVLYFENGELNNWRK